MAPTKSVPAALHSELSEYASLLRAIRTNSTLDIVPQLSRSGPHFEAEAEDTASLESDEDAQGAIHESLKLPDGKKASKGKGKAKATPSPQKSKRKGDDSWTRWPLLQEDCPVPEWSLDEEIMAIAEQYLRSQTSSRPVEASTPDSDRSADAGTSTNKDAADDIDDFTLSPAHLSGLTSTAASKLSSVFSLLAFHRLNATFTKHGRVTPMSWQDVLEVVGVAGIFDLAIVESVKERMEAIFGASHSQIINRMQVLEASDRALAEAEASFGCDLLPTRPPPPRRTKKKNTKTNRVGVVNDEQPQPAVADQIPLDGEQADIDMDVDEPD